MNTIEVLGITVKLCEIMRLVRVMKEKGGSIMKERIDKNVPKPIVFLGACW